MNNIIVDTGFWFALYREKDAHHNKAVKLSEYLDIGEVIIPFPSLYETINTHFTKRVEYMDSFKRFINRKNVHLVDDSPYKDSALDLTINSSINLKRSLSLVDMIIRLMISDVKMNIKYLLTFNAGDFIDVCLPRKIEILSE